MIYNSDITIKSMEDFVKLIMLSEPDEMEYDLQTTAEMLLPGISTFLLKETNDMPNRLGSLIKSIIETDIVNICLENGLKLDKLVHIGDDYITSPIMMPTIDRLKEIKSAMKEYCPMRGTGQINNTCEECIYSLSGDGWKKSIISFADVVAGMATSDINIDFDVYQDSIKRLLDLTQIIKFALDEANGEK